MKLTREQAIAEHRKMWRWIAEETEKQKRCVAKLEYLKLYFKNEFIFNHCFCCEYDNNCNHNVIKLDCKFCPVDWGNKMPQYQCSDKFWEDDDEGLFRK